MEIKMEQQKKSNKLFINIINGMRYYFNNTSDGWV